MALLPRTAAKRVREDLAYSPVVGILGPRQVGKTTLARAIADERPATWFDLQRPFDVRRDRVRVVVRAAGRGW